MLQEILTIKSDDTLGRSKTYEAIVKNEPIRRPNIPASFEVLVNELKGLSLDVDLIGRQEEKEEDLQEPDTDQVKAKPATAVKASKESKKSDK